MKSLPLSYKIQLVPGLYVLLCIPLILLAEKYTFSQAPFHATQLLAVNVCCRQSAWRIVSAPVYTRWV